MAQYIDYIEFAVGDHAAARDFYGAAFGWQFNDYGPEYSGIQGPAGDEVGGLNSTGAAAGVLVLLRTDDLDAALARVTAAGGTITVEPFDYPGGRRFHFTDPAGNALGVYQPGE